MNNTEIKALRRNIDALNKSRIDLQIAGHLTDGEAFYLMDLVDSLEDKFIAATNAIAEVNAAARREWQCMTLAQREAKKAADRPSGRNGHHGTSIA